MIKVISGIAILVSLCFSGPAAADPVILRAAQMVDVERGEIVRPAELVIEDGIITEVNPVCAPRRCKDH